MAESTNTEVKSGRASVVIAIATAGLFITSIAGLIFIRHELVELRRQNSYLERTMRQSYRPLGVVRYGEELKEGMVIVGYSKPTKPGRISLSGEPNIWNRGKGILIYLGSFSYLSKEEIDFRRAFLNNEVGSVRFDALYTHARRTPVLPESYFAAYFEWEDVDFEETYYLYVLFFYEDQDGNLYDTEHLVVLKFEKKPKVLETALLPNLEDTYIRDKYHHYSSKEKQALIMAIQRQSHPLAGVIRGEL